MLTAGEALFVILFLGFCAFLLGGCLGAVYAILGGG